MTRAMTLRPISIDRPHDSGALKHFAAARMLEIGELARQTTGRPQPRCIFVGQDAKKRWVVKDDAGAIGAVFRSAEPALRFGRREALAVGCHLVIAGNPLELDCLKS